MQIRVMTKKDVEDSIAYYETLRDSEATGYEQQLEYLYRTLNKMNEKEEE